NLKHTMQSSPLQSLVDDPTMLSTSHLPSLHALAVQVQYNLQYQHSWTDLRLHTHSPTANEPLPRPLLSGLPPERLYVHPDEQIQLLKDAERRRKAKQKEGEDIGILDVQARPELEWLLPTRLGEKWTLRRLSEVFNVITAVPPEPDATDKDDHRPTNPWRATKRLVLATVGSDSTVVYYIVHDGVVKPRQN
ncbi:tRNA-splicing endonuclease subunit Sen15, partial [Clohesyomyces aquaticus]